MTPTSDPPLCQRGLIQARVTSVDGDKTRALRTPLAGSDGPAPVGLSGQGLAAPDRALLGVGPHRSLRARMSVRSHAGSRRPVTSRSVFEPLLGVTVSISWTSAKAP